MKQLSCFLLVLYLFLFLNNQVNAQTISPTPPQEITAEQQAAGSSVLNNFFSGFDWISSGLIFNTPSLLDSSINLKDGTELSGLGQYRTIFSDIAIPIFVLIISYIALSHITNDNTLQLKNFLKRLVFVVVLFIITPGILTYSIQFINLLNEKIIDKNAYNLATFVLNYVDSDNFRNLIRFNASPLSFFNQNTILQLIVLVIAVGFFMIGFLYVVFQAMIRFIALLFLSVIFPLVLPFALSERTENITNTYFKTWFTFLIQQPAFVLGFAIVSTIMGSILSSNGGSIGTLFLFSASLIFLGGVNIFVGRIFGDGWSLVSSNAQSMIGNRAITGTTNEVKRGAFTGRSVGVRSYAGSFIGRKIGLTQSKVKQNDKDAKDHYSNGTKGSEESQNHSRKGAKTLDDNPPYYSKKFTLDELRAKSKRRKQEMNNDSAKPIISSTQKYKTDKLQNKESTFDTLNRKSYATNFTRSKRSKEDVPAAKTEFRPQFKTFIRPESKVQNKSSDNNTL
ncbi:MAG TPA: type IV secretion system protein [Candidatus Limnocylindrales bacterium]|nr:type IV secretion system protein [Candidatus Limnocylindrales bacterium]